MKISHVSALALTVLLVACGKPDASGIYVAAADHEATMVQLVQGQDGKLTGRLQVTSFAPDGAITTKDAVVDGSVSGHDLILRPASVWLGGLQASGSFSGSKLILTGNGFTLEANRSSLEAYQAAVTKLQSVAGEKRQQVAGERAESRAATMLADNIARVTSAADQLRAAAGQLNDAVSRSPNFGQLAMANTSRIGQMVKRASGLSDLDRNQLAVAANQIEVDTNQIEVARSQYAIRLNSIVDNAKGAVATVAELCGKSPPAQLSDSCAGATAAANTFKDAFARGTRSFSPYKQRVQIEMDRQNALSQRISG